MRELTAKTVEKAAGLLGVSTSRIRQRAVRASRQASSSSVCTAIPIEAGTTEFADFQIEAMLATEGRTSTAS
ncbi:hypothetical protein [Rhodococcus wratislaviensis]|uniref:Uncharacterized protein n=1 Tax=Rhodococcus wratislaviensis NBRC 100605 TaxID=1219028 RepID=X0PXQ3_RHOWR|nr:hypothetical protein [Rhodococcus wratislaviensis]GAF43132.1 hypothetical protein RW1_006_00240 [Rhodococcus wratislaviensis NBRC 100605]